MQLIRRGFSRKWSRHIGLAKDLGVISLNVNVPISSLQIFMAFPQKWHGLLLIPFFLSVGLLSLAQELTDAQIDVVSARLSEASQKRSVFKENVQSF
jgi:hypothetical protein